MTVHSGLTKEGKEQGERMLNQVWEQSVTTEKHICHHGACPLTWGERKQSGCVSDSDIPKHRAIRGG